MAIRATIQQLKNAYANYLQKANPKISPRAPNSYWDIQAGAMAGQFLDLYGNLQLLENSIYPQNSVGQQADLWLYSRGLVARGGATYGTITAKVTTGTVPVLIPANTTFTDILTNNTYEVLADITVSSLTDVFTLYAISPGANYLEPVNNTLTSTIGTDDYTITVQSSSNGQLVESDQSCINRVLMDIRVPKAGSRTTDYYEYCLQANSLLPVPIITDAIIIPMFYTINDISKLGIFPLIGTKVTEFQLNQGLLATTSFVAYSRTPAPEVITAVSNFIQSQRLVGLAAVILPNYTYNVAGANSASFGNNPNPDLQVQISLAEGYDLDTPIQINSQNQNNEPLTVTLTARELIQREVRRAICNQQYGATVENSGREITANSIQNVLNYQLDSINGNVAKILTDIKLPNGNIDVPTTAISISSVYYTYDVAGYNNIVVSLI